MEPTEAEVIHITPNMPEWLVEIVRSIYYLRCDLSLRRLRIAISPAEYKEYRDYVKHGGIFHYAIRGFPIIVEDDPTNPQIVTEVIDGH